MWGGNYIHFCIFSSFKPLKGHRKRLLPLPQGRKNNISTIAQALVVGSFESKAQLVVFIQFVLPQLHK
jgi:hypothetical protein